MLLLMPGYPGESYWQRERVVYRLLPFFAGTLFVGFSSWVTILSDPKTHRIALIKRNLAYVAVGVVLVFAVLVLNDVYFHIPIPRER